MSSATKTDPDLWEKVKDELMESDKGGEPGQWSARKAQLAVQEYKKRGGDYADDGPDQEDTDKNGRGKGSIASLENKTECELYDMAQDREVEGRSDMSKDDLVKALAND